MARKQAASSNNASSKTPTTTADAGAAPTSAQAAVPQANGRRPAQEPPRALSVPMLILFIIVPLVALLWDSEAPSRPFALTRVPSADGSATTTTKLINPRILLVTAHPDDEVLFAPTVLSLLSEDKKKNATLWAVSLSTGDFEGGKVLGELRTVEWARSWNTLGLGRDKRAIFNEPDLQDSKDTRWEPVAIAKHLAPIVQKNEIDTILTFDDQGVTLHPQHASIPAGVKHLLKLKGKSTSQVPPRLYTLKTYAWSSQYGFFSPIVEHLSLGLRSLLRDFSALQESQKGVTPGASPESQIEIPNTIFVASIKQYVTAWKALLQHKSQLRPSLFALAVWGKYLWVNEWVEVPLDA